MRSGSNGCVIKKFVFFNLSAAYSKLSSSIPTVDMGIDSRRRHASDESDVQPTRSPLSLNPATPISRPRQMTQDTDPFVSPAPHTKVIVLFYFIKRATVIFTLTSNALNVFLHSAQYQCVFQGVKFAPNSPERLEYTAEHSLIPAPPPADKTEMDITEKLGSQ